MILLTQEDIWEPEFLSNLSQSSNASHIIVSVDKTDMK